MAENLLRKINAGLGFLYRQKDFLGFYERKLLCNALLSPFFDHCAPIWYHSINQATRTKLQTAQNKIARFIFNRGPRASITRSDFTTLNWFPVHERVKYLSLVMLFKIRNFGPLHLQSDFQTIASRHDHNTRNCKYNLLLPNCRTNGQLSFLYRSIKYWNDLPLDLKQARSLSCLKSKLRCHITSTL